MKLEGFIAIRYLFATRQRSVANVISWVSLVGLLVSTAALIIVLSVYNGIGEVTKSLFSTFDPELVVEPAEGKTFHTADIDYRALCQCEGVAHVSQMVSESAWITYGGNQAIATLRGVDASYRALSGLDTLLAEGRYALEAGDLPALMVGGELWYSLGMRVHANALAAVHIPKRGTTSMGFTMDEAFNIGYALPMACFFIQQDIDRRYMVTDADFVRRLMHYAPDECTALAIGLRPGANVDRVKRQVSQILAGSATPLTVKDRYDQQPLYFKIFRTERLGIYLILSLIVLISTLSLVASLSLLIINKGRDVFILRSMGMTVQRVRRAFVLEGVLICGVAVLAGLIAGFLVCWLQQTFGLVRMGDGNFVVSAFPVAMRGVDFLITFLLVMLISSISVLLTVHRARL